MLPRNSFRERRDHVTLASPAERQGADRWGYDTRG